MREATNENRNHDASQLIRPLVMFKNGELWQDKMAFVLNKVKTYQKYFFDDLELLNPATITFWFQDYIAKPPAAMILEIGDSEQPAGLFIGNRFYKNAVNIIVIIWDRHYLGRDDIAQAGLKFAFDLGFRKLFTYVSEDNRLSLSYNKRLGFRQIGILEKEFFSQGRARNLIAFELTKENWHKQQTGEKSWQTYLHLEPIESLPNNHRGRLCNPASLEISEPDRHYRSVAKIHLKQVNPGQRPLEILDLDYHYPSADRHNPLVDKTHLKQASLGQRTLQVLRSWIKHFLMH